MPRLYPELITTQSVAGVARPFAFVESPSGRVRFWDAIRIRMNLVICSGPGLGEGRPVLPAILDTGSPLTVFGDTIWPTFPPGTIEFVEAAPGAMPLQFAVAGARCPFRLAHISLGVQDDERPIGRLGAQRVLAQFAEDNGRLRTNVLVGVSHSVLAGRRLVREMTLEADEPEPADPVRRRRTFGQIWRLSSY